MQNAYIHLIRSSAIDTSAFARECTPSYFNNEGQPIVVESGETKLRSCLGENYGPGYYAFEAMLAEWRERGDLEGLILG